MSHGDADPAGEGSVVLLQAPGAADSAAETSLGGMLGGLFGAGSGRRQLPVEAMGQSAARSIGSQVGREIIPSVLGPILKKR